MTGAQRIVHLGPGAFFRAFLVDFTDRAGGDWGITAVSLKSSGMRDALAPQGFDYHTATLSADGTTYRKNDCIQSILVAPENPQAVVDVMADAATKLVTLTITEKGYCYIPATGTLDLTHPYIQADLTGGAGPVSAIGFITAALARRRDAGLAPFVLLSCDNLPDNGRVAKQVIVDFAQQSDADLAGWIKQNMPAPCSMVDRITPAVTEDTLDRAEQDLGVRDNGVVAHEPFAQWVIEDSVGQDRPAWDAAGATIVSRVTAHEHMKLRCLNGAHSALAYLGYLSGHQTIAQATAHPILQRFCEQFWREEVVPTLTVPEGENLNAYCNALMARFQNPAIRHLTWQIAMDGSQKLPQRILGTVADNLSVGRDITLSAHVIAGWMRYVCGADESGEPIDVRDPMATTLLETGQTGEPDKRVGAFLALRAIFPQDLAQDTRFKTAVTNAMNAQQDLNTLAALSQALER